MKKTHLKKILEKVLSKKIHHQVTQEKAKMIPQQDLKKKNKIQEKAKMILLSGLKRKRKRMKMKILLKLKI